MIPVDDLAAWLTQIWDEQEELWRQGLRHPRVIEQTASREALARIAADRQILALHKPYQRIIGLGCEVCLGSANKGKDAAFPGFPCPTVRLLAQPYADRPGFQEAWRVSE